MPYAKDQIGKRFGKLTVIRFAGRRSGQARLICRCRCGTRTTVYWTNLQSGTTTSCGCYRKTRLLKHGEGRKGHQSTEYICWARIVGRCTNPKNTSWQWYGGRGIKVCARWRKSYEAFLADMGRRPSWAHSIDRIDVNADYRKSNCRWVTLKEQHRNRRCSHLVTFRGQTRTLMEWCRRTGLKYWTLAARLRAGWTIDDAITKPLNPGGKGCPRPTIRRENHPQAKCSPEIAETIRREVTAGMTHKTIASRHGISPGLVSRIATGEAWVEGSSLGDER